jgi:hypothetical protein
MSQKIIYPQEDGSIAMIIPAPDCGVTIEEIARKDVPIGVSYLIVNDNDLPEDDTYFNAWEADFSNPHGHGIGHEAWFAERETNQ